MRLLFSASATALLLGTALATSSVAATPYTGCPAGYHRAESEGGGVGSVNNATRRAESEGGGVGSVNLRTRQAEAEGGGVGSVTNATRKAEALAGMPCVANSR